jgi:hypothetical protein
MSHIGIITAWNYAWSVLTACFVLGVAIFLLDRKFGIKIYRFLYDFFHKDPMPSDVDRGFLYNQSTNRGVTRSVPFDRVQPVHGVGTRLLNELHRGAHCLASDVTGLGRRLLGGSLGLQVAASPQRVPRQSG